MPTQICKGDIEQMKPKLIEGATVTKFAPDIHFVQYEGRFVKIDDAQFALISDFNGNSTLADIISAHLNMGDTAVFNRIIFLLDRLNRVELFDVECSKVLKTSLKRKRPLFEFSRNLTTVKPNPFFKVAGRFLTSIPGLVILFIFAVASVFQPHLRGINILRELTPESLSSGTSYLLAILFIVAVIFSVQSLISFFSGAALSSKDIAFPVCFRLKFGIPSLWVNSIPVVSSGRKSATVHYIMKMLVPFSIAGIASVIWRYGFLREGMAVIHVVSVAIGLWAVSPLLKSPFTLLANFFVKGDGKTSTFLRRRFIKDVLTFKKSSAETDRLILLSALGLIWLYAIYNYFWYVANSTVSHLLAATISESGLTLFLIAVSLSFIVLPLLLLAIGTVTVVLGNIKSVVKTPVARMRSLADQITSKKVPPKAQVTAFLKLIPLFSGLDENELLLLCSHLKLHRFSSGRKIIQQGETGDCFYTIVSGEVDVVVEDFSGREKTVEKLETGDSFGEIALIERVPRTASVVAIKPTVIFEMNRESFEKFVVASAGGEEKVTNMIRLGKLLINIPLFSFMSPKQISSVIRRLEIERLEAGKVFFDQGDKGDKFYVIIDGTVHITRKEGDVKTVDKTLEKGSFFGEIALVKEIPRTAKVKAVSDCIVGTLTKEQFFEVMGHSLFSGEELDAVLNERALQIGKEAIESCSSN
jgi:CRP-like cAMP-binding protein